LRFIDLSLPITLLCLESMKKMEARNPNYREYVQSKILRNKFISAIGLEFTSIEPGYLEGELVFKEMLEQQNGWLHGGVTSAILDMVQGFASYSMVDEGQKVVTVEAKISYFNPGTAAKFYTRGGVVKAGRRFHFCEGEVYYLAEDGSEVTIAKGSTTMAVI
jgi:uncharacterized protein (TIGR00369 family)